MTRPVDLDAIEVRANAATPGPWDWSGDYPAGTCPHRPDHWDNHGPNLVGSSGPPVITAWGHDAWGLIIDDADAEFIAHARTDVPALVAEVRAARAVVAKVWWHQEHDDITCAYCADLLDAYERAVVR